MNQYYRVISHDMDTDSNDNEVILSRSSTTVVNVAKKVTWLRITKVKATIVRSLMELATHLVNIDTSTKTASP